LVSPDDLPVPIFFFDVADEAAWEQLVVDQEDPNAYWNGGGFLRNAPVDAAATFEKAIWVSTTVEPSFGWRGRRIRAGFTVPRRHQNMRQLRIVTAGSLEVECDTAGVETVRPGGFWTVDAGVPYRMTAGPDGVSYMECWDGNLALVETYWHDDPSWARR
jgi:quercetin dioxygenase-like cupin family protein